MVINRCFGGFSISAAAIQRYGELAGLDLFSKENGVWELNWFCKTDKGDEYFSSRNIPRDDPISFEWLRKWEKLVGVVLQS